MLQQRGATLQLVLGRKREREECNHEARAQTLNVYCPEDVVARIETAVSQERIDPFEDDVDRGFPSGLTHE